MDRWIKIDIVATLALIGISISIVFIKLFFNQTNAWTGLFPLLLLPLVLNDLKNDLRSVRTLG